MLFKPELFTDDAKNWKKLWSIRLAVASAFFGGLEASLPLWNSELDSGVFALLSTTTAIGAAVSRVIKQKLNDV